MGPLHDEKNAALHESEDDLASVYSILDSWVPDPGDQLIHLVVQRYGYCRWLQLEQRWLEHPDGSFTMAYSNSFLSPDGFFPIAQENKYWGKFSYFSKKLYTVCTH